MLILRVISIRVQIIFHASYVKQCQIITIQVQIILFPMLNNMINIQVQIILHMFLMLNYVKSNIQSIYKIKLFKS